MTDIDVVRPTHLSHLVFRQGDGRETLCGADAGWWEHQPLCRRCVERMRSRGEPHDSPGPTLDELLGDPVIQATGLLTVNAGAFELAVTHLLWVLAERANPSETSTQERRTLGKKLEAVRELAEARVTDVGLRDMITTLVEAGFSLGERRARVVHGVTLERQADDGRYTRLLATWQGQYRESSERFTVDDVLGIAVELWAAREQTLRLVARVARGESKS